MATRGRKPKPTAMKELEGNPGKHPPNTSEPKPNKKAPACPKWLEPEAKKEWRRFAKQMEAIGILIEVDMAAFAGYCQAYARWKEAEEFITQHGTIVKIPSGYWQQVPQVSIAQTYLKIMNKFAEQFGLTPSSRSRIIASDVGPADAADEVHAQPNRKLYDILTKGSGDAREQPLFFLITTAGTDKESIGFESDDGLRLSDRSESSSVEKLCREIVEGSITEDGYFAFETKCDLGLIFTTDEEGHLVVEYGEDDVSV